MSCSFALPESGECPSPHLKILILRPVPEVIQIRLVPDVNDHSIGHIIDPHVGDNVIQIAVPAGPVSVVTGVWCRRILGSICSPEIMDQEDEVGVELARAVVIGQNRGKPVLEILDGIINTSPRDLPCTQSNPISSRGLERESGRLQLSRNCSRCR